MTPYQTETYKSLITISTEGFKFLALANGGASVALLAYLGNVVSKSGEVPDLTYSMAYFLAGLFLCGAAMAFAYLTQLHLYNSSYGWVPEVGHKKWLWLSMGSFVLSLCSFAAGSMSAVASFSGHEPRTPQQVEQVENPTQSRPVTPAPPSPEQAPVKASTPMAPASASNGSLQKSR